MAAAIATDLGYVGVLAVELFVLKDGVPSVASIVNRAAPDKASWPRWIRASG